MPDQVREPVKNPFSDWMVRHRLSIQRTADALGCSKGAVQNWRKNGAPRYILLACAAWSCGVEPIR